jgi:hypothetical protein
MKTLSIKWRVALGATTLSVALIGIVTAIQVSLLRRDIAEVLSAQQFTLASQVAHDLDGKLAASLNALARSAESLPRDILNDPPRVRTFYAQRPEMLVVFDDIILLGADGQVTADYPQIVGRTSIRAADRRYFQRRYRRPASGNLGTSTEQAPNATDHQHGRSRVRGRERSIGGVLTGILRLQRRTFCATLHPPRSARPATSLA